MIDFYKKADEKRRGELEFVPEEIEEKFMLLLLSKKNKRSKAPRKASVTNAVKQSVVRSAPVRPRRVFCDAYYEQIV
ncbi:MAG: hypothetical protein IJP16_08080 [Clostridia bacterium]|nr:hypothetical protein [Clostridia bacterium]